MDSRKREDSAQEKATDREKKVCRFLREALRPLKDFICWDVALVSDLKRLVQDRGLGLGKEGLMVPELHRFNTPGEVEDFWMVSRAQPERGIS